MQVIAGLALSLFAVGILRGQTTIIQNDFSGSTPGRYNGQTGQSLGTATNLGNVTGLRTDIWVHSTNGAGNSASLYHLWDIAMRSRDPVNIVSAAAPGTAFSLYFKYEPWNATLTGGFVGMGWALSAGCDGVSSYTAGNDDRVMIGLRRTDATTQAARLSSGGRFGTFLASSDLPAANFNTVELNMETGMWYQLSFVLRFNYDANLPGNSTWTLSGLRLVYWGADGQTGGTPLIYQLSDYTWNPTYGNNLNTSHDAFAYIAGNGERGVVRIDNVLVTIIPEPGPVAIFCAAAGFTMAGRRLLKNAKSRPRL